MDCSVFNSLVFYSLAGFSFLVGLGFGSDRLSVHGGLGVILFAPLSRMVSCADGKLTI